MPPPSRPPLARACYDNNVDEIKRLLASGADPLEPVPDGSPFAGGFAIHVCCHFAHLDCLRCLLATGCLGQLDDGYQGTHFVSTEEDKTPLIMLCLRAGHTVPATPFTVTGQTSPSPSESHLATAACVKLLLDEGASLEPVLKYRVTDRDPFPHRRDRVNDVVLGLKGDNALEIARLADDEALVRIIDESAGLRYSPKTHRRFPRAARYAAAKLLRPCYQIGSGALAPVWAEHVLPFLVSRTSRGAVPPVSRKVLFIDALSDDQVEAMAASDDSAEQAAAELELQRRRMAAL